MTYTLTLWLFIAGQMIGAEVVLPASIDCPATAQATAAENDAQLVAFSCVLEIGV